MNTEIRKVYVAGLKTLQQAGQLNYETLAYYAKESDVDQAILEQIAHDEAMTIEAGEPKNNVISMRDREAGKRIDDALKMADMLIDLHGGEIDKPATWDDAEVPRQMIEDAATRWGATFKKVEMYCWDLHDRGAPYQYIKEYLLDIED
jgi:hypothetical protein